MGGSIGEGNTTVSAEFNIYADPEAADVVFRSGVPISMMGLDITHQAVLDRGSATALRAGGGMSGRIAAELTEFALERNMAWNGATTTAMHDAVAIAHLGDPRPHRCRGLPRDAGHDPGAGPWAHGLRRAAVPAPARRPGRQCRCRDPDRPGAVRAPPDRRVRRASVGRPRCATWRSATRTPSGPRSTPPTDGRSQLVAALGDDGPTLDLVANLGVNGYTSADLIREELPALDGLAPDFATVLIGVNDVVQGVPLPTYEANVATILDTLLVASPGRPDRDGRGPGLHGDAGRRGLRRPGASDTTASSPPTRSWRGCPPSAGSPSWTSSTSRCEAATDRSLVADDGLHPSGVQYARWVDRIRPVVEGLLAP